MEELESQISRLVDTYADKVYRLAFSYLKNREDAEDTVQDVFIKLMEKPPRFESREHEKAWILRVAINLCKNKLKRSWNQNTALTNVPEAAYTDSYHEDDTVLRAVMSLPEQPRAVIHLYYYEGYKTPEIAKILRIRESSVRSSLHRARKQLKTLLEEAYDFE